MSLLIDLGNTRLKAAMGAPDGGITMLGDAPHRNEGIAAALDRVLGPTFGGAGDALCANVAGETAARTLAEELQARGVPALSFLRPAPEAFGVRCAYAAPARLGADRWAALLAARGLTGGACLVVDAGSALTIDAMAPGGDHLGGWIIPGLRMMVEALEARTGDLARLRLASTGDIPALFPADTGPAMSEGARLAAIGAVRAAQARLAAHSNTTPRVLLTGGDAIILLPAIEGAEHVPELVLRGLARAATFHERGMNPGAFQGS
jgi:type III pantothenate kinase